MDINDRLYVEIHPLSGSHVPVPHPIEHGRFDPAYVYKVLGMYNPSETSECYFVLSNTDRQIWFIPQRHLLAYGLVDSDEMFLTKDRAETLRGHNGRVSGKTNGNAPANGNGSRGFADGRFQANGHGVNGK